MASIVIGATNITRVRLGDAILLLSIIQDLSRKKNISIDFERVCEILSEFSYVNSFNKLEDLAQDVVNKVSGKKFVFDLDVWRSEEYTISRKNIDKTISTNVINIDMLQYLNKKIWPMLIKSLKFRISKDKPIKQYCGLIIPYDDIFEIYDYNPKYGKEICIEKTANSLNDVITWFNANMIDFINLSCIQPEVNCLCVKFSLFI